jgi:adenylate cyclase
LAAILAVDVAGYSRLMGEDEEGTLAALRTIRRELGDPKIKEHRGRIVKTTGDGLLVEFASVVDAVRCAIEVQREMATRNVGVPPQRRIEFRMGINLGDIIAEDGDIFGDGVNIAARLEALADPGGICVSRVVRDQVRDKLDFSFEDLGEQQVKNIARPLRIHRIDLGSTCELPGGDPPDSGTIPPPRPAPRKPSIAVLPFANMSGDPEQEYFSEGVTEDIITNLSRNRAFFVISRSTSFTYKGPAVDVGKVARELGVRYVLEGSVRRAGNRVRITAQLIDAETGHHLWADRYDRDLADVFAVQDEIAQSIVGAIAPGIISAEIRHAQRKDPSQLDAWDRTVRAHWHIRRFTQSDLAEARRLLQEAIALDPTNSMAFADLPSHVISKRSSAGARVSPRHMPAPARPRARRSVSMTATPRPISSWRSTRCFRAGMKKPGAVCAARPISIPTPHLRMATSASAMLLPASVKRHCRSSTTRSA